MSNADGCLVMLDNNWPVFVMAVIIGLLLVTILIVAMADRRIDASQEHEANALQRVARRDDLTGLANRLYMREMLGAAISSTSEMFSFALLYLDLDRFKPVNDQFGHQVGDALLIAVSERIRQSLNPLDIAARFGGDEFIVLQDIGGILSEASALADQLIASLSRDFLIDGHRISISASIGIAVFPSPNTTTEHLLRNADIALYQSKSDGGGRYTFFMPEMIEFLLRQRELENELLDAIELKQLEVYYQPLYGCETGNLLGFEALLRWNHPIRGVIRPDEFIPLAEKSGLIVPLGILTLETACKDAMCWPSSFRVAVNFSAIQLRSTHLLGSLDSVLRKTGLTSSRLVIEVTEPALIDNPQQALTALTRLKEAGLMLAIDNFGTGYSSLTHLQNFPFDCIKIDRSLIKDLETSAKSEQIVRAIIGLGQGLQIDVLAEGVETIGQLKMLRELRCNNVQGYLFGYPMSIHNVLDFIQSYSSLINTRPAVRI